MEKLKKSIMVTWDFSPVSESALKHAFKITSNVKYNIILFHIVNETGEIAPAEEKLKQRAEEIRKDHNEEVGILVRQGKLFKEISDYVSEEDNNVDMVIMGTHGMKGSQKLFGSWALKVIAGSAVPFIVVQKDPVQEQYKNIVFPIDFKSENKEKLTWAIFLGKYFNSRVHLYKNPLGDKDLQKRMNINLNFAIRFLIQNNIEYEIHEAPKGGNFQKDILAFSKKVMADLILITTTKHITKADFIFGAKEQYLIANEEAIPVMCVNPKSNFAKVGQFMYG